MAGVSLTAASRELAARDPVIASLYDEHGPCRLGPKPKPVDRYRVLCQAIVYQQLAGRAAAAIWSRVEETASGEVTPGAILAAGPETLRSAGLSRSKVASLLDLASRVDEGEIDLARLGRFDDARVKSILTTVRGIGPWTAEMFLMFVLHRLDVWPVGDLGVRKGYQAAYDLANLPDPQELAERGEAFRPYRSIAAWYCWRAAATVVPA